MTEKSGWRTSKHSGAVGGSSTKMEQDAPESDRNRASFPCWGKVKRVFLKLLL